MTETKATPATDEEIARVGEMIHGTFPILWIKAETADGLLSRISADAETIQSLKGDLEEARDFSRMQTKALENRNEEIRVKDGEIERLHGVVQAVRVARQKDNDWPAAELATLRDQVRVLRKALTRLSYHSYRYMTGSWIKCKGNNPNKMCDMCAAAAALATTEPKG